jgi:hypothetical protein
MTYKLHARLLNRLDHRNARQYRARVAHPGNPLMTLSAVAMNTNSSTAATRFGAPYRISRPRVCHRTGANGLCGEQLQRRAIAQRRFGLAQPNRGILRSISRFSRMIADDSCRLRRFLASTYGRVVPSISPCALRSFATALVARARRLPHPPKSRLGVPLGRPLRPHEPNLAINRHQDCPQRV